jgi:hypothetical protein
MNPPSEVFIRTDITIIGDSMPSGRPRKNFSPQYDHTTRSRSHHKKIADAAFVPPKRKPMNELGEWPSA